MTIKDFRDLDTWKVGLELAVRIYELIDRLPRDERFEMASQMRRAALSVPSNIAEGHSSTLRKRYRYHVRVALGSVAELMTCIELGLRLGYWNEETAKRLDRDLVRMSQLLHGVARSLQRQLASRVIQLLALAAVAQALY